MAGVLPLKRMRERQESEQEKDREPSRRRPRDQPPQRYKCSAGPTGRL